MIRSALITVNGHNLMYHQVGDGPAVLFVHGITTSSFIWEEVIANFDPGYTLISVDLLGCGESDKPLDVDYSIKTQATLIADFQKALNIEKVHLIGHDIGGGIAQILMVNHPDLYYDITLINPVGYDFWPVQPIKALRTPIIRQLAMISLDRGLLNKLIINGMYKKDRFSKSLEVKFKNEITSKEHRKPFLHLIKCLNNIHLMEICEKFNKVSIPVLIIRGNRDRYLSSSITKRLHEDIPDSQLISNDTSGHFIQLDEPEWLTHKIIQFIKRGSK